MRPHLAHYFGQQRPVYVKETHEKETYGKSPMIQRHGLPMIPHLAHCPGQTCQKRPVYTKVTYAMKPMKRVLWNSATDFRAYFISRITSGKHVKRDLYIRKWPMKRVLWESYDTAPRTFEYTSPRALPLADVSRETCIYESDPCKETYEKSPMKQRHRLLIIPHLAHYL